MVFLKYFFLINVGFQNILSYHILQLKFFQNSVDHFIMCPWECRIWCLCMWFISTFLGALVQNDVGIFLDYTLAEVNQSIWDEKRDGIIFTFREC